MKKIIVWFLLLPCILTAEYRFQCVSQPDAHTTLTTYFTDSEPDFHQVKTVRDQGGKVISETKTTFLSGKSACAIPTQFKTGCNTHVMTEGSDFNYSFRCDDAFGDIVFLESSNIAMFRCQGENVPSHLNEITFSNCW